MKKIKNEGVMKEEQTFLVKKLLVLLLMEENLKE